MKGGKKKGQNPLQEAQQIFEVTTKTPNEYLVEQKQYAGKLQKLSKILFDNAQPTNGGQSNYAPLELYIDDMDTEQIWQQLEAQNESLWDDCMKESCRLLSLNEDKYKLKIRYPGEESAASEEEEDDDEGAELNGQDDDDVEDEDDEALASSEEDLGDEEEEEEDDSDEERRKAKKKSQALWKPTKIVPSVVDDQFFKLSEMEAFLESEDKKEMDRMNGKAPTPDDYDSEDEDQEIDYFDSLSTDTESEEDEDDDDDAERVKDREKHMKFAEFFDEDDQEEEAAEVEESAESRKLRFRAEREEKNKRKKSEMKEDLGLDDSEGGSDDEENGQSEDEQNGADEQSDEDDDDDNEANDENEDDVNEEADKSEFALRQDRLQNRIEEFEENAMGDKPWQLKGEITSATRPKNSLLEEVLEFDSVARPPPQITEQTTECLEDIIKRRIKSKAWDDVQRKFKPAHDQQDFRKNLVLNQEKSKESLAQIYEKEFLEKVHKLNNVDDDAKPDEPPAHADIRKAVKDLFVKLDALSNFHFTAKPVAAEPKIITNLPAIEMEEVAPVSVSDATLLAPEEVRARPVGDEIGKSERTDADKKRERRKKKLHQKLTKQRDDKRVEEKEKLGVKVTTKEKQKQLMNQVTKSRNVIKGKDAASADSKALKSSKSFFTQLQDNATAKLKGGKKKSSTDLSASEANAKRYKL